MGQLRRIYGLLDDAPKIPVHTLVGTFFAASVIPFEESTDKPSYWRYRLAENPRGAWRDGTADAGGGGYRILRMYRFGKYTPLAATQRR